MLIYIAADHRGYNLKEILKKHLQNSGYEAVDFGNDKLDENDDYVDFAAAVAKEVSRDISLGRGILICGSGVGMDVVANKFRNVRASLCFSTDHAQTARAHDNSNILVLPADFVDEETAKKIVSIWLQTQFDNDPDHSRRLQKISELETKTTNYFE
ncbi:MAG: hypothetical protein UV58_C0008G0008 [Candidatus Wolfebacteria bacterium GW2011_GWC1_43_10]|uniref:Ribose-5-phosphate isomerase n=2 Tax=Candidatus Wolfeibacteriota TaxID=1752735 RepID=A0A0G1EHX8_9BACT|nr:MAG: hypothetical protein UV58_C0008G0008 [Candidatus Wolfebacteria bacterium GW2011_GWC1_43_10]KKT22638.1 MAG: hypothetical protein UW08_C0005G0013 [Parcubacteria group bacterium GW2011_GWB1_43_8b]OGM89629.1 MAG: hypothetical protein A2108_01510 [Candidatus Wolfebacteria bacterium GWA1_42_9]